jgi:cytochrome c oxidase subunit 2
MACAACSDSPSAVDPQGPRANDIATLWWVLLGVGTVVWLVVVGALAYAVLRRRHATAEERPTVSDPQKTVLVLGAVIPGVILLSLMFFIMNTLSNVNAPADPAALKVEIIGHDWWWEVRYPDQKFTTANEVHIPVGKPVQLILTSADVIHSFWVPQLQGKMDLIPGQTNTLWVQADKAGDYRGQCAEYCGLQHANMAIRVIAQPQGDLDTWLADQSRPAAQPADAETMNGQQLFLGSACVYCHAVQGTNAAGTIGPDLTHLASRGFIGAGALPNDPEHLAAWITNPQDAKPGNQMPATPLDQTSLNALLAYLDSLK